MIITCPYCKKKYFRIKKILDKKFKNIPNDERIIICSKCKGRFYYNHGPDYIQKNKLKKPKFNIEIFFESFAKINLPEYIIARPHMLFDYALSKGFGYEEEKDFDFGKEWINPEYTDFMIPKRSFLNISKDFEYIPLIQLIEDDFTYSISKSEYGYLYSKKSNISFLIGGGFATWGDGQNTSLPVPIKKFKNFPKKKFAQLPKIVFDSLVKDESFNIVILNDNFKWNIKLIKKKLHSHIKDRKKFIRNLKHLPNPLHDYYDEYKEAGNKGNYIKFIDSLPADEIKKFDWFYNIWFFLTPEEKMNGKKPAYPKISDWKKYAIL